MKVDMIVIRHPNPGVPSLFQQKLMQQLLMLVMGHTNIQLKHY